MRLSSFIDKMATKSIVRIAELMANNRGHIFHGKVKIMYFVASVQLLS